MNLLALETSAEICGVALFSEGRFIDGEDRHSPRRHNELLADTVADVLDRNHIKLTDLDQIALSIGPGSFTGLRIGLSYAKGLAMGLDLGIIPVPTLPGLIEGELPVEYPALAITWSHGRQVYCTELTDEDHSTSITLVDWDSDRIQGYAGQRIGWLPEQFETGGVAIHPVYHSAAKVGKFALRKGLEETPDLALLVSDYHQEFSARPIKNART